MSASLTYRLRLHTPLEVPPLGATPRRLAALSAGLTQIGLHPLAAVPLALVLVGSAIIGYVGVVLVTVRDGLLAATLALGRRRL
jgi:hypothetical protein